MNEHIAKTIKDDPADRLEIELGDSKQPETFYPQVKIKRWDNEVNASFRLLDDEPKTLTTEGEKIKLVGAKKEVHLYDIAPCKEHKEGAYEFEVILKEKPTSNELEFSIETKGLSFRYQLPLDEKLLGKDSQVVQATPTAAYNKDGRIIVYKPENAVGSYAVYHSTKRNYVLGQKNYKCGKAFHIFRPHYVDAVGKETWCGLHIDEQKKLLTVTIPQDFLDSAIYPIVGNDLTFGYTSMGTGFKVLAEDGQWETCYRAGSAWTMPVGGGTADHIRAGLWSDADVYDAKVFINQKDSGGAGNHGQIAVKENTGITTDEHWEEFTLSSEELTSEVVYILNITADPNSIEPFGGYAYLKFDENGAVASYSESQTYDTSESPWVVNAEGTTNDYSIYCTYEAAAVGPAGVKTINETAIASVKTINETAIASVKTINESAA